MINGSSINSRVINGNLGRALSFDLSDIVYIGESLAVGVNRTHTEDENVIISEALIFGLNRGTTISEVVTVGELLGFSFNYGLNLSDSVFISENLDIAIGTGSLNINDDPVTISETLGLSVQRGILMNDYIKYYTDLLIMQYRGKPKALAHVTALVKQALIDLMPLILQRSFDLNTAEGVQLDIIGKYIGVTRVVDTFSGLVVLSDSDYRLLLLIKQSTNSLGSSMYDIQLFMKENLSGIIYVFDNLNMSMSFYVNSTYISNVLAQAIATQGVLPRPMGVSMIAVYLPNFDKIFGMRNYSSNNGAFGFNSYSVYDSDIQFLKYEDEL